MKHFWQAMRNYTLLKGRMTRNAFWQYMLFFVIYWVAVLIMQEVVNMFFTFRFVIAIYNIMMLAPVLSAMVRRLHDTGKSGKWVLYLSGLAAMLLIITSYLVLNTIMGKGSYSVIIEALPIIELVILGILIYKLSVAGEVGANKYGPDPMEVETNEVGE